MFAKYGKSEIVSILLINGVTIVILTLLARCYWGTYFMLTPFIFFMFIGLYFFRDPIRHVPDDKNLVIIPADGKITEIACRNNMYKVGIYMSPWNVHITRMPFTGEVLSIKDTPGKLLPAIKPESSALNASKTIYIQTVHGEMILKQIAGPVANRIVFEPVIGEKMMTGQKVGMVKYGSRVEVFIPVAEFELRVEMNQKVVAGETVIGEFR